MSVVGTHIISRPYIEARCAPLRAGGWRVDSIRGTTDHPHVGDPYLAVERHMDATEGNRMIYATPRWNGDCGYCAEMNIPPGMATQCRRCGQTVCVGHTTAHEPLCKPLSEHFTDKPFGWEAA